jgi:hypothetical protein
MRPIHRYQTRQFCSPTDFYISQVVWRALLTIIVKRRVFSSADTDKKERKKQIICKLLFQEFRMISTRARCGYSPEESQSQKGLFPKSGIM